MLQIVSYRSVFEPCNKKQTAEGTVSNSLLCAGKVWRDKVPKEDNVYKISLN